MGKYYPTYSPSVPKCLRVFTTWEMLSRKVRIFPMDRVTAIKNHYRMEEWKQLLLDFQSSGMKLYEWCESRNVTKDMYYYWLRKIREQACDELESNSNQNHALTSFKKLEVITPVPNTTAAVIIRLGGATVEINEGTTQQTIQAVLLALQSVC